MNDASPPRPDRHPARRLVLAAALATSAAAMAPSIARAAEPSPIKNGDVNGSGKLDLTDAVYLLTHLFLGGPTPVAIECVQAPPVEARFRLYVELVCGGNPIDVTMTMCGESLVQTSGSPTLECREFTAAEATCAATLETSTLSCGDLALCAEIPVKEGSVYDVVLYFDGLAPAAVWIEQPLEGEGCCPPFPLPQVPATGFFGFCAGGGEAEEPADWGPADGAGRS